jgi:hypothetical protein
MRDRSGKVVRKGDLVQIDLYGPGGGGSSRGYYITDLDGVVASAGIEANVWLTVSLEEDIEEHLGLMRGDSGRLPMVITEEDDIAIVAFGFVNRVAEALRDTGIAPHGVREAMHELLKPGSEFCE